MQDKAYHLGCPIWACEHWRGSLFTRKASRSDFLPQYSGVFSTVEGNSTFYGLPSEDTVRRWAEATTDGFRFVLKFPRAITHECRLLEAAGATNEFLDLLALLHESNRLGPTFLQLPPTFGPSALDQLATYLNNLPREFAFALEVRHAGFFDGGANESALRDLLTQLKIDRVVFDTRPLFSKPPSDEFEETSQSRKPRVPVRTEATGSQPILRLVGRNDVADIDLWIQEWAPIVASWIAQGRTPFVFAHTPDDTHAPEMARRFHRQLQQHVPLPPLAEWPGETESPEAKQLELF